MGPSHARVLFGEAGLKSSAVFPDELLGESHYFSESCSCFGGGNGVMNGYEKRGGVSASALRASVTSLPVNMVLGSPIREPMPLPKAPALVFGSGSFCGGGCPVCLRVLSSSTGLHLTGVSCVPWL